MPCVVASDMDLHCLNNGAQDYRTDVSDNITVGTQQNITVLTSTSAPDKKVLG